MTKEPLEAEPLDAVALPEMAAMASAPDLAPPPRSDQQDERLPMVGAVLIILLLLMGAWAGGLFSGGEDDEEGPDSLPGSGNVAWGEPVWLPRNPDCVDEQNGQDYPEYAIGYEPSIAVDSQGNLYYTAHKDLRWAGPNGGPGGGEGGLPGPGPFACNPFPGSSTSWDYYASWFFVSQDGGKTWGPPNDWGPVEPVTGLASGSMVFPGDEGDIGVDAQDRVYFVDTTIEDDWLHVWGDGGNDYLMGQRLQSSTADDRPWVTAQGNGIVHYLGNNGASVQGIPLSPNTSGNGRYWYYRGELTGNYVVMDQGRAAEGGWAHLAAERDGDHVYIVQEGNNGGSGGIKVWVSDDTGLTWAEPVMVGPLEGSHPEGYPWVAAGENGTVFVAWQNSPHGGREPGTLYIARSDDFGANWAYWNISSGHPFEEGGVFLYPNLDVGPGNVVGYAYYGNQGDHTAGDEWHLYADVLVDPQPGDLFQFYAPDPQPLYTSSEQDAAEDDLHPLHDFFEVVIDPNDLSLNIAYQYNIGDHPFEEGEEQRYLMFIKADWVGED